MRKVAPGDQLWSVESIAKRLDTTERNVSKHMNDLHIEPVKLGRLTRYTESDYEDLLVYLRTKE